MGLYVYVQLANLIIGDWKDISIVHVNIIIKSDVSPFAIFPWLCAWNLLSLLLCSWWWVEIVGHILACRSYSFVCTLHHLIIIIVQTYVQTYLKTLNLWNACQIYFVECVSKIKHIISVIDYTICVAVCFQFTHFPCDDWDNLYTLSYDHHQIESMNYYPMFRVMSWNIGMRCMSLYILTHIIIIIIMIMMMITIIIVFIIIALSSFLLLSFSLSSSSSSSSLISILMITFINIINVMFFISMTIALLSNGKYICRHLSSIYFKIYLIIINGCFCPCMVCILCVNWLRPNDTYMCKT